MTSLGHPGAVSIKDIRLDGRVAIVTGAARGLGHAMAVALARAGASVAFADIDDAALPQAMADVEGKPGCGAVVGLAGDITSEAACERIVGRTVAEFGALHILVNNAGKGPTHVAQAPRTRSLKFWEADPDVWQEVIVTNVLGTFLMSRAAAPHMIAAGWGRIVNVTTSLATMQRRANSPYGVSKAAIETESLIWAQDLEGTGVTVNTLIPGGASDTTFVGEAERAALRAAGRALLPPSVMIAPVLWLASALSDGVTGARFVGRLWDERLVPSEAAAKAREAPVLLPPATTSAAS
jgi:NAD(P)-dependent dehydrogenase (short-subunit alcohol dehydrogenase family)